MPEYNYWTDDLDGGLQDPEADYWRREREDADEAERIVESSMLLGERVDKTIEGAIEFAGSVIGALFKVAGAIFLLWMFIWLVKTLWYLS